MAIRKVKAVSFAYRIVEKDNDTGLVHRQVLRARRGEEFDDSVLSPYELDRLERAGAFETEEDQQDTVSDLDFITATVEELQAWIEDDKPTINEVLNATGGDPAIAQKMLDAENAATGGDPRDGLVKGLAKIIETGTQ